MTKKLARIWRGNLKQSVISGYEQEPKNTQRKLSHAVVRDKGFLSEFIAIFDHFYPEQNSG